VDDFVADVIGSGIAPRWQLKDKGLKKELQELWNDWTMEADFYNRADFYGLQSLICRAYMDAGESLTRIIPVRMNEANTVPLKLHVFEADHLDHTYNTWANGNEIRMGIEINRDAKRLAYWPFVDHPGETFITQRNWVDRVRIPANRITHVFRQLRAGQMRGRPWMASIIVKMHELDQYDDAELVRKKGAALLGSGYITEPMGGMIDPADYFGKRGTADSEGRDVIALEPGTFPILPLGMEPKFPNPPDTGTTYEPWKKDHYRQVSVGVRRTYDQFTGDLSDVNFSSIRAGLLRIRRILMQLQFQDLVFQFCQPIAAAWLDQAILTRVIVIRDYFKNRYKYLRINWRPDGWPWVDPLKDIMAEKMSVRNGFKSRAQVIAERGGDIETVDEEIAEDNARADEKGFVFDSDPRHTAESGSFQKAENAILEEAAKEAAKGAQNGE
jgi:lambda family phage portal protein